MLNKKLPEIVWIIIAVMALVTSLHALIFREIKDSTTFFIIFALALMVYFFRRNRRLYHNQSSDS